MVLHRSNRSNIAKKFYFQNSVNNSVSGYGFIETHTRIFWYVMETLWLDFANEALECFFQIVTSLPNSVRGEWSSIQTCTLPTPRFTSQCPIAVGFLLEYPSPRQLVKSVVESVTPLKQHFNGKVGVGILFCLLLVSLNHIIYVITEFCLIYARGWKNHKRLIIAYIVKQCQFLCSH